ncbi:MAG: uncharacterized protein K0S65_6162 [Labilithrix sp.]|nr:uncharacterized protein [Labilithrix sp.]
MRSLLALAACSLLAIIPACADEKIVVQATPPPAVQGSPAEEAVEEPEPEETPQPAIDPLVIDLGEVPAGTDVTFEVPQGALGFNITAGGNVFDPNRPFGIERITDPNGNVVHDGFTPRGGASKTSVAVFDAIASASVPQGEGVPTDLGGTWKVRFGVFGWPSLKPKLKGRVHVQSSGDGAFHGGQLDLHIHVPSGLRIANRVVAASQAEGDPDINERIDTFFALTTSLLGIEKGKVVFSEEASSYRELDGIEEILQGFAISSGEKDGTPVLHILMTNLIGQDGEPIASGIAPGIPGAANIFGRSVSGIIVTTSPSPEDDATTMFHEAGHFFGLKHTSEIDGQSFDPLSDTPACEEIARGGSFECPDRTNVMFPSSTLDSRNTLSPMQVRVFRGSPVYRAFTSETASTMSLQAPSAPFAFKRSYRTSGKSVLSPVERELSFGFCGLNALDANGLVKRHGRAQAIAQLRAAAADRDLAPYIRGRANLALKRLGAN